MMPKQYSDASAHAFFGKEFSQWDAELTGTKTAAAFEGFSHILVKGGSLELGCRWVPQASPSGSPSLALPSGRTPTP